MEKAPLIHFRDEPESAFLPMEASESIETLRAPGANAKVAGLPWVMYLLKAMKMPWCLSALCTERTNGTCDKSTTY